MTTKTTITLAAEIVRTSALSQREIDRVLSTLLGLQGRRARKMSEAIQHRLAQDPDMLFKVKSASTPAEVEMYRTLIAADISDAVLG